MKKRKKYKKKLKNNRQNLYHVNVTREKYKTKNLRQGI